MKKLDQREPLRIPIKCNVYLYWRDDSVALLINPKDWVSGVWISRFYLAAEKETPGVGGFGPVWAGNEADQPLENMDFTVLPFRKPKVVKVLQQLRARKVPAEPK